MRQVDLDENEAANREAHAGADFATVDEELEKILRAPEKIWNA